MINVIIVNWNSSSDVDSCICAAIASVGVDLRFFVVDNNSNIGDLSSLKNILARYKAGNIDVRLIESKENLGYAGGNNVALANIFEGKFSGDFLILNPDVRLSPDALMSMSKSLRADVAIVTPLMFSPRGDFMHGSIKLVGFKQIFFPPAVDSESSTDCSQGSCMLVSSSALKSPVLFDERFFMYWEEVELSLRFRALGYKLVVANNAFAQRGKNSKSREVAVFYYSIRNSRLIMKIHGSSFSFFAYVAYILNLFFLTLKFYRTPLFFIEVNISLLSGFLHSCLNVFGRRR